MAPEQGQYKARSRVEKHHLADTENQKPKNSKPKKKPKILQSTLLFLVIGFIAMFVGSLIGYGILGGGNPLQVLNPVTWTHIYQLVFG